MAKTIISEGKTTTEAIEKGLKQLNVTKNMVDIKILEEEQKRSFFSILAPRVVKVELTVKENTTSKKEEKKIVSKKEERQEKKNTFEKNEQEPREIQRREQCTKDEIETAKRQIRTFLDVFLKQIETNNPVQYQLLEEDGYLVVTMEGKQINYLIGYRGEVLNSLQSILSSIANQNVQNKVRVLLDIEGYRKQREKTLEELAVKLSKTVLRTGKSVTLEPMTAYERKIIHSKLQGNERIRTYSIGEEPYRKVVITLNK